ncbi:unnamed protein product [Spodoptera exigua]|nr:unnamed protein product [Spodoptera exigua]
MYARVIAVENISNGKVGNALITPLLLRSSMGGADCLPSVLYENVCYGGMAVRWYGGYANVFRLGGGEAMGGRGYFAGVASSHAPAAGGARRVALACHLDVADSAEL